MKQLLSRDNSSTRWDNHQGPGEQTSPSEWNLTPGPPFGEPSLEDSVAHGDAWERRRTKEEGVPLYVPVTIERCPLLVYESLAQLRRKHQRLGSVAAVTRYASRTGLRVVQKLPGLAELRAIRAQAYREGNELVLATFSNLSLKPPTLMGSQDRRLSAWVYQWVAGAVADLATDLGLPRVTIYTLTLVSGLAQSTHWVEPQYAARFIQCTRDFATYILNRVEIAARLTSRN